MTDNATLFNVRRLGAGVTLDEVAGGRNPIFAMAAKIFCSLRKSQHETVGKPKVELTFAQTEPGE